VLATDGVPTLCDPALQSGGLAAAMDNLDDVAAEGQEAGISSFVIGVFAPEEEVAVAQYLDALATSGGTDEAFIINTEQDVAARLVEAFNAVRTVTICEYEIPAEGLSYDATRFLVSISTADGADLELERRDSAAACDPVTGGFFFDHDPTGSEPPTRIILCPASCDLDPVALHVTCGP